MKAVIFDLDGTLIDSIQEAYNRYVSTCNYFNIKYRSFENYKEIIGNDPCNLFDNKEIIAYFKDSYDFEDTGSIKFYNGIKDLLIYLKAKGILLYILTARPRKVLFEVVRYNYFLSNIFKSHNLEAYDNKANGVFRILELNSNLKINDFIMVGDSLSDCIGAKGNGITFIGAGWGYGNMNKLILEGADLICSSPAALEKLFRRILDNE